MREHECRDKREQVPTPFLYYSETFSIIAESMEPVSNMLSHTMHIGEAIKKELERQGKTVVWFAEKLPCHRTHVYHILHRSSIDTHLLERISKILNHNFFTDIAKELKE